VYATNAARAYAIRKAEELEAKLGSGHPTFVKPMTQSHVTGGFWLVSTDIHCSTHFTPRLKPAICCADDDFGGVHFCSCQGLPLRFCRKYLPKANEWITLVDQNEDETQTYYLHLKTGLSAGWRKFSLDHKLVDGDCLVFELIKRNTFKVVRL
jgi:hypothetical protein